ncbi:MAG: acylphosphatase, partial [Acidimicrobiales bacterium]
PDGAVEAVFEGAERAIGELVEWCRQGPPRARVAGVETTHEEPAGLTRFEIAR